MKKCNHCKESLNPEARICPKCGRSQHTFWFWLERPGLVTLIGIIALFIAFLQYQSARSQKVAAEIAASQALESLKKSEEAAFEAKKTLWKIDSLKSEIYKMDSVNHLLFRLTLENSWIQAHTPIMRAHAGSEKVKKYERNVMQIMKLSESDSSARAQWFRSFDYYVNRKKYEK